MRSQRTVAALDVFEWTPLCGHPQRRCRNDTQTNRLSTALASGLLHYSGGALDSSSARRCCAAAGRARGHAHPDAPAAWPPRLPPSSDTTAGARASARHALCCGASAERLHACGSDLHPWQVLCSSLSCARACTETRGDAQNRCVRDARYMPSVVHAVKVADKHDGAPRKRPGPVSSVRL